MKILGRGNQYFISYYLLHLSQTLVLEILYEKQHYYYFLTTEMDLPLTWITFSNCFGLEMRKKGDGVKKKKKIKH